ncbi:MAG: ABC transporter ATP-binding protein, partial [Symbiobacteriaceae bacterium]|nr:ABC transporter ATP-binding protein [Symbiobacteriaceae bacterium]
MKKLFAYVQPYLKSMALVVCLVFAQVMAELQMPNLMSNIVNNGVSTGDTSYIIQVGMQMLVVALIATACSISASFFSGRNALGVARDLRIGIFRKVESFSQMEFDKISTSSLITRTTNDVQQMQMIILSSQRMFVSSPLNFVGALINAMNKDAQLVRILFIAIPCVVAVVISVQRRAVPLFSLGQRKIDRLNQVLREGLSGVRVIRAFHREDYQSQRFNEANFDLTANSIRVQRIMATNWPMMMLVINSATIAVVWFGARNINAGFIRIGDLMAFTQYLSTILFSLMNLSMMFVSIPRAQVSANRIAEILNTEPLIQDPEAPTSLPTLLNPKQGLQVVFNDVTFRYPGGENPALRNISFTANSGETVAIIGSTGSGKTTIANLIMRFYDVEEGTVTVDGIDVRHLTLSDLRHQIGFIPQKAVLFSGAIADNLLYGNETATEAMRWEALRIAQAEDFVS